MLEARHAARMKTVEHPEKLTRIELRKKQAESRRLAREGYTDRLRKEALRRILDSLSARERRVLEMRYGLDGEHPRTLDEVGRTFNVTRERIRQIENQCLKKLRAMAGSHALRDVA